MRNLLIATSTLVFIATANAPALAYDQADFEQNVEAIMAEYMPQIQALEDRAEALDDDMPTEAEVILNLGEWEKVSFSMDIPEFTMDRWEYSMHIPEVTMNLRRFSWDVPEFFMGTTRVLGVKVDLPQTRMRRHEWSMDIPEVTMRLREFSMDIPEVTMERREFSFHLPKIHVGGPRDELDEMTAAGEAIQIEAERLSQEMTAEIAAETRTLLTQGRVDAERQFAFALDTISAGIASAPNNDLRNELQAQKAEIERQRTEVLAQIDEQLQAVSSS